MRHTTTHSFAQTHRALFAVMHFGSNCGKLQMWLVRTLQHLELQCGEGRGQRTSGKQQRANSVDRAGSEGIIQSEGQRHASHAEGSRTHTHKEPHRQFLLHRTMLWGHWMLITIKKPLTWLLNSVGKKPSWEDNRDYFRNLSRNTVSKIILLYNCLGTKLTTEV